MTGNPFDAGIWVESEAIGRIPVLRSCVIGRSPEAQVVLSDKKVSRKHALLNLQGTEVWLVDLGSRNGTYLNERRLCFPCRLSDGDRISIGEESLTVAIKGQEPSAVETEEMDPTISQQTVKICWLLVADIRGSTGLLQDQATEEVRQRVSQWFAKCRGIIESHQGAINKYLGDGFFAYWAGQEGSEEAVAQAALELLALRDLSLIPFRFVLHHGKVHVGAEGTMGEEPLFGNDVNFAFRMEKLAGRLGQDDLFSEAARTRLESRIAFETAGSHPLDGFRGEHPFFVIQST